MGFSCRVSDRNFALFLFSAVPPHLASCFGNFRKVSLHKQDTACKTYSLIRQPTRTLHDILISSKSLPESCSVVSPKIFFSQQKSSKLKFRSMKNVHRRGAGKKEEINVEAKPIAPYVELPRIREMCERNGKLLLLLFDDGKPDVRKPSVRKRKCFETRA